MVIQIVMMRAATVTTASATVPIPISQSAALGVLTGVGEGLETAITRPKLSGCPVAERRITK
jgi:hypothetical protein